jgi:hypothetical protein
VCNRYSNAATRAKIETQFARIVLFEWAKRFNIAPTDMAVSAPGPVTLFAPDASENPNRIGVGKPYAGFE